MMILKDNNCIRGNLSRTVKILRLIPLLACHSFRDTGRRQIPGTDSKDFVTHGTWFSCLHWVLLSHPPKFHDGNADAGLDGFCTVCLCHNWGTLRLRRSNPLKEELANLPNSPHNPIQKNYLNYLGQESDLSSALKAGIFLSFKSFFFSI